MAEKGELRPRVNVCDICKVFGSSSQQFFEHMTGQKHRTAATRVSHESVPQLHRFQYVIDTYMKAEPMVGLEYVEELQGQNMYRCVLCDFSGQRSPLFLHITGLQHITRYVAKHHPQLLPQGVKSTKKATQIVAAMICQDYGRKTIKEIREDAEPTPEKVAKPCFLPRVLVPAKATKKAKKKATKLAAATKKATKLAVTTICQDHGKKTITETRKDAKPTHASNITPRQTPSTQSHASNIIPTPERLAKHSSDPQSTRKPGNGDQRLAGFKGNADFLDYLQKFQIRSDEDAKIIRVISENCWQALLRYGQEQGEEPWGEELPQGEDPRGQELQGEEPQGEASEDLPAPANRTDKGFSVGNHGNVVPVSAAQTDATQIFFSSIKNMEEAEVRDILQKIAATNPAFRGIHVPNVIQYLRATGRLKTS